MIESLSWLSEEGGDNGAFRVCVSAGESRESFDVVSHESSLTTKDTARQTATETRNISRKDAKAAKVGKNGEKNS